ncbi:MAG: PIG-L family deacetylase [Planctomycetales bacterium]|nr:PIG-L family deacetylase [Planctomycetales bacterium]
MSQLRLLILGAHPDDGEFHAGGIASAYARQGHRVRVVSVTNGAAGHHFREPSELAERRRREASRAARVIGAESEVWEFPDGALEPSLEVRARVIRCIREYQPDLVLTHRLCDYHPDHRSVGQAVQDASYLVTVPLVQPEVPHLKQDPVVAYMPDLFTKPTPLQPDVVLDIGPWIDTIVEMLACHESQVFEWLPFNRGRECPADTPGAERPSAERMAWLRDWYAERAAARADRFRSALCQRYGQAAGERVQYAEAFEISEYAAPLDEQARERLFGFLN